jgi:hypothetical protein
MSTMNTKSASGANNVFDGSRLLVSVPEAAKALSLSCRTINGYIATKAIVSRKIGRRRLILVSSLKAFANKDHDGLSEWSGVAARPSAV